MTKIKIKCDPDVSVSRSDILQIFSGANVKCSSLVPVQNNSEFLAYCHSDVDADRIFGDGCIDALKAIGCNPIMPMQVRAYRSVIIRRLDNIIYGSSIDDILCEVNSRNDCLNAQAVFKFPSAKMIKITFSDREMALGCIRDGLKLFNLFISPTDIKQEEFYNIKTCYRCYLLDAHYTKDCPEPETYIICSNCSELGHTFRECSATNKRCINCNKPHSTLSFSCSRRKEIVDRLREAEKSRVFNSPTGGNPWLAPASLPEKNWSTIQDSVVKSIMCLVVSSAKERDEPGCFSRVLSELQLANGAPQFKFGSVTPPDFRSILELDSLPNVLSESGRGQVASKCIPDSIQGRGTIPKESKSIHHNTRPLSDVGAKSKPRSFPSIFIIKKKTAPMLTSNNIEKLYRDGQIILESSEKLPPDECLRLLLGDLIECKTAISKAKTKDFRSLKSSNLN